MAAVAGAAAARISLARSEAPDSPVDRALFPDPNYTDSVRGAASAGCAGPEHVAVMYGPQRSPCSLSSP